MVERLPQFYRAWDRKSNFFQFLRGFSKELDEDQKQMFSVMRSHWIDTAYSSDLDLLGSLFRLSRRPGELDDSFRRRIKFYIPEFTGGGTRESIIAQTMLYLDMRDQSPLLIENPPTDQISRKSVKHGDKWRVYSHSIDNEIPTIVITIQEGNYRLPGPMITDLDTQSSVKFDGVIESGQALVIDENGKAALDGIDITDKLIKTGNIMMPRKGSSWTFRDSLTPIIGRFDDAAFDRNAYEMYIPTTNLEIKWNARLLASFEIAVPENVLNNSGVTQSELEQMVDFIKASGVKSFVKIVTSIDDYEDRLNGELERRKQAREAIQQPERQEGQQHLKLQEEGQKSKIDEEQFFAMEEQAEADQTVPQEQQAIQGEEQLGKEKMEQLQPSEEPELTQPESEAKESQQRVTEDQTEPQDQQPIQGDEQQDKDKIEPIQPSEEPTQTQPESETKGQQLQEVENVDQTNRPLQHTRQTDQEQQKSRVQADQHFEVDNLNNKVQNELSELAQNGNELRTKEQSEQQQQKRGKGKEPEQEQEHEKKGE
jgi:hypothetical protein